MRSPEPAEHGLERWRYDGLESREWSAYPWSVVARRSADLVWLYFDANPAYFCNEVVAIQPIEAFLAAGAPEGVPSALAAAVTEHLLAARVPGRSTWLDLAVVLDGDDRFRLHAVSVTLDGHMLDAVPLPGPAYAGLGGWPSPGPHHEAVRLLVRPGPADVGLEVAVTGPPGTSPNWSERAAMTLAVQAAPHARTPVTVRVDVGAWPVVRLAQPS